MSDAPVNRVADLSLTTSDRKKLREAKITTVAELKAAIEDGTIYSRVKSCSDDLVLRCKTAILANEKGEKPGFDWKQYWMPAVIGGLLAVLSAVLSAVLPYYMEKKPVNTVVVPGSLPVPRDMKRFAVVLAKFEGDEQDAVHQRLIDHWLAIKGLQVVTLSGSLGPKGVADEAAVAASQKDAGEVCDQAKADAVIWGRIEKSASGQQVRLYWKWSAIQDRGRQEDSFTPRYELELPVLPSEVAAKVLGLWLTVYDAEYRTPRGGGQISSQNEYLTGVAEAVSEANPYQLSVDQRRALLLVLDQCEKIIGERNGSFSLQESARTRLDELERHWTKPGAPTRWATIQSMRGDFSFIDWKHEFDPKNAEAIARDALRAYDAAQVVFNQNDFPILYLNIEREKIRVELAQAGGEKNWGKVRGVAEKTAKLIERAQKTTGLAPTTIAELQNSQGVIYLALALRTDREDAQSIESDLESAEKCFAVARTGLEPFADRVPLMKATTAAHLVRAKVELGRRRKNAAMLEEARALADSAGKRIEGFGPTALSLELAWLHGDAVRELGRLAKDPKRVCEAIAIHDKASKIRSNYAKEHSAIFLSADESSLKEDFMLLARLDMKMFRECTRRHGFDPDFIIKDLKLDE